MSGAEADEGANGARRFFMIRVMKTATTTLVRHAVDNFGRRGVYPVGGIDLTPGDIDPAMSIPYLLNLPEERLAEIRVFIGHFPLIAYEMLGIECVTVTLLRDPIARIISHVVQAQRIPLYKDHSFEAIYEDPLLFPFFLHNHQAKYFCMRPGDRLSGIMDPIEIDDDRLALAKANLERIDVIGLTESFDEFLDEIRARFGWSIRPDVAENVSSQRWEPSAAFRRRMEADNAADIELYEHARAYYARRQRGLS
jgi:hypothetical protein